MRLTDKKHHTSCLSFLCVVLKWTSDQGTAAAAADVQRGPVTPLRWTGRQDGQTRSSGRQEVIQNATESSRDKTAPRSSTLSEMRACTSVSLSEGKQKGLEGYSPALNVSVASKMCFSMSTHPKNNSRRHSTPKNTWSGTAAAHCFLMHQNVLLQVNN